MTNPAPILHPISQDALLDDVEALARAVAGDGWAVDFVVGIGRGGLVPAVHLSHRIDRPMLSVDWSATLGGVADPRLPMLAAMSAQGRRLLMVDDINDSGGTIAAIGQRIVELGGVAEQVRFAVLIDNVRSGSQVAYRARTIDRAQDKRWFVFPWEAGAREEAIVAEARSVPHRIG